MTEKRLKISRKLARRFLLTHQFLLSPRSLRGPEGIIEILKRLGCIQFDTINVVGRNADLVLFSRIKDYEQKLLEAMLYQDRTLVDGFDKVASIYQTTDWPYFERRRASFAAYYQKRSLEVAEQLPQVLEEIKKSGPVSSLDFKDQQKVDWHWSETNIARAALEALLAQGLIGIHHRVNTRRQYDLVERLLPQSILDLPDPNQALEQYQEWHILRRLGGLGLASLRSGEHWQGILGVKAKERREIIKRLVEEEKIIEVIIEGVEAQKFYMRQADLPTLNAVQNSNSQKLQITFIAPLDNLLWDRKLIADLFGFAYVWEVYKPKKARRFGYYTLPVLYGERFIARMDAKFEKKSGILNINGWWWEEGIAPSQSMRNAVVSRFRQFKDFLGAEDIEVLDTSVNAEFLRELH